MHHCDMVTLRADETGYGQGLLFPYVLKYEPNRKLGIHLKPTEYRPGPWRVAKIQDGGLVAEQNQRLKRYGIEGPPSLKVNDYLVRVNGVFTKEGIKCQLQDGKEQYKHILVHHCFAPDPAPDVEPWMGAVSELLKHCFMSVNEILSCGRLGPARLGTTVPKSSDNFFV